MKRVVAILLVGVLCALAVVLAVLRNGDSAGDVDSAAVVQGAAHPLKPQVASKMHRTGHAKPVLGFGMDEDCDRTPAEKSLAARIEKALDEEDLSAAIACADEAQKCDIAEIRQAMVETLGWFGEKALPELTPFLADADEDVRDSAMNEWTMALSSIEDDGVKIKTVELAMGVLADTDVLDEISNEYIGVDEKIAVESLVRIITSGGSAAGVGKAEEIYEFVTGDPWAGVDEAARWLEEEYTPSEEE